MTNFVYDIETYPNVFTIAIEDYCYEISHRVNDIDKIIQALDYINYYKGRMVGFNNEGFDYPVLDYVIKNRATAFMAYEFAMSIINSEDRFSHIIWDKDRYVPQLDLFKIHHFDNLAKATSLKVLEFNMRSRSIQDLPYPVGTHLTDDQIDQLKIYNLHDVSETRKFLEKSRDEIRFREELTEKYGKNFINFNDTKIGKEYFKMRLEESSPGITKSPMGGPRQTHRPQINFQEVVLPYIQFRHPAFVAVQDWITRQVITETKGVFSDITEYSLGSLYQYSKTKKVRKKGRLTLAEWQNIRLTWMETSKTGIEYTCWNQAKNLNCTVNGMNFVFGTGGIHASVDNKAFVTDAEGQIIDVDATSFYPSNAIVNGFYPEHIGTLFCDIYADIKTERISYEKGTTENKCLKLASNGTFGDTNNKFSCFFDPKCTMQITVNGQLLLCMLIDSVLQIPGLEFIQANTDGITVKCPHNQIANFRTKCQEWEKFTCLDLEEVLYSRMWVRDVNNYVAEEQDGGKLKKKGTYQDKLEWHKNHSAIVTQKAAVDYLVNGTSIEKFIYNHTDKMDFLLRTKVPRTCILLHGDRQVQNVTRYYISNTGHPLLKIMPPTKKKPGINRAIGINKGWLATECNTWNDNLSGINYKYYIQEAEKLTGCVNC